MPYCGAPAWLSDATPAAGAGQARPSPVPISEDEAARLIAGAPTVADPFAILSRRGGRPMTDEQVAEFLSHDAHPAAEIPPLPVARVAAALPAAPAPTLAYATRHDRDARYSDPRLLAELPVAFRVLRVAPWVLVALFMIFAMIYSVFR